jgi:hypothetical protein
MARNGQYVQRSIGLTPADWQELQQEADKEGRSRESLVRFIIEDWLRGRDSTGSGGGKRKA